MGSYECQCKTNNGDFQDSLDFSDFDNCDSNDFSTGNYSLYLTFSIGLMLIDILMVFCISSGRKYLLQLEKFCIQCHQASLNTRENNQIRFRPSIGELDTRL